MREIRNGVKRIWGWRPGLLGVACGLLLLSLCPQAAQAQATQDSELDGIKYGDYNIKQSIEFGGRFTDFTGDKSAYDTFVNLHSGPRLLGSTLEMHSLDHNGLFFDRLFLSNSGYGGDPNDVTRLRVSKNKWYDFDGMFRRDENSWGYSLLANPLNPATPAFPNAPAGFSPVLGFSPHQMNLVRRMGDYNLTLLPQSKLRFRVGYSRNVAEGPSLSSIHQGTEQALLQDWKTVVNAYRFGVDYKVLPRTRISFDEIISLYKGDTAYTDPVPTTNFPLQAFPAGSGAGPLVDIGYSRSVAANQPCGSGGTTGPFLNPPNPPGTVLATCSAYFDYFRQGRTRTTSPTEQVSIVSNYWKNLDLTGRFSYSGGDTKVANWMEAWDGRESRTNARNSLLSGPVFGQRVNASADFGAAWHATDRLTISDSFHFSNFHNPMTFDASLCQFFSANLVTPANAFTPGAATPLPTICTSPADSNAGVPVHAGSSGPDVSILNATLFQKVEEKTNLFEVAYRFTSRFGARIGYRYRARAIDLSDAEAGTFLFFPNNPNGRSPTPPFANQLDQFGNPILDPVTGNTIPQRCPAANNLADGSCEISLSFASGINETLIHENSGLLGIWARPLNNLRVSFDMELMSADNSFTRISPRQTQEYRWRTTYRPVQWANLSGSIRIWEGRDNVAEVRNLQHDRAYGFAISLEPVKQFAIDLGYDYNDVHSQILICYVSSAAPAGLAKCPTAGLVEQLSTYQNNSSMGFFDMRISPIRHMTARIGTNITYTNGTTILLDPNAVPGPLNTHWYQPYAGVDYSFTKNWMGRVYWGFYDYGEDGTTLAQDVFAPRNFRGHLGTISLKYAF
jgi:hypothetical protein